jgi:UDP-2,3-diacylglucosamine pyrophosphatase LpxH
MLDALILSDIHLGSEACQARLVCQLLEQIHHGEVRTARLILNGDVFDSFDFARLNKNHWKVLSLLRKLSDRLDVIWLAGNHDGDAEVIAHLLGATLLNDYIFTSGPQRFLVLHGHIFDAFIEKHPILTWCGDQIYRFLQWLDSTHAFAKRAKHGSKTFLRCARKVEVGAVALARRRGCTAVCCGHTHSAVVRTKGPIHYYNSGCWTELPGNYLTVADGQVSLHDLKPQSVLQAVPI